MSIALTLCTFGNVNTLLFPTLVVFTHHLSLQPSVSLPMTACSVLSLLTITPIFLLLYPLWDPLIPCYQQTWHQHSWNIRCIFLWSYLEFYLATAYPEIMKSKHWWMLYPNPPEYFLAADFTALAQCLVNAGSANDVINANLPCSLKDLETERRE